MLIEISINVRKESNLFTHVNEGFAAYLFFRNLFLISQNTGVYMVNYFYDCSSALVFASVCWYVWGGV